MKPTVLKMGTRGSALALAQSRITAQALRRFHPKIQIETVVISTSGDKFAEMPPREAAAQGDGTKGLFVKEIEEALLDDRIDFAVHSAKDLPADTPKDLVIAAYPERDDPRDVFVAKVGLSWRNLPAGTRVGTSSLRRKMQILSIYPKAEIIPLRGNIDTRLQKLTDGQCDALVLAAAGLLRLGRGDSPVEAISPDQIVPCPGQGALAIQIRRERIDLADLFRSLDDAKTRAAVECERAFLAALGGGCSTPLGAFAEILGKNLFLRVFWAAKEGDTPVRFKKSCPDLRLSRSFASKLALRVKAGMLDESGEV